MIESKQRIPDFLEAYKPIEESVTFDDDTDNENENDDVSANGGGGAWGGIQMGATEDNEPPSANWGVGAANDPWRAPEASNEDGALAANWG